MSADVISNARWLVDAIQRGLEAAGGTGVEPALKRLGEQDHSTAAARAAMPRSLPVCRYLSETVAASLMVDAGVAAAAAACVCDLHWRQTAGYSDEVLGPGFLDNYGHCELIGPQGVFPGDDFLLGFLLLGPNRHYRDHRHPAPELYWTLTGPTEWKRNTSAFTIKQAGETVWHDPHEVHATRTNDVPMLAVWIWTRATATPAELAA